MDAKGKVSRKHFQQAMFFFRGNENNHHTSAGFSALVLSDRIQRRVGKTQTILFCQRQHEFLFEMRFYPDRDLLVKVLTSSASFNMAKKKNPPSVFNSTKKPGFIPLSLPLQ